MLRLHTPKEDERYGRQRNVSGNGRFVRGQVGKSARGNGPEAGKPGREDGPEAGKPGREDGPEAGKPGSTDGSEIG